jgi:hypothetical protein
MNDDHEPRDPALDALLGEHSTETPPAHIDAAILAAAHRAVDSGPRPALATQAWRWWMPLAAAAVIGLIVVGVLPLAPSIVAESPPIVSDVPTGAAPAPLPSFMSIQIPDQPEKAVAATPSSATPSLAARAEGQPVPRAAAKVTAPERKLERDRPVPAEPRKDRVLGEADDARKGQAAAAGALDPAIESSPAPTPGNAVSPLARPPGLAAPQRAPSADARDEFETRPHTADEWIARIRALRSRGDVHEATRALADFRAAFSDADARLPADLREWANAPR